MIEKKIEIVIPTYNRSDYLNKTLEYLLNSPFKGCKITIRDNASTDYTPQICEKYSKLFKNMNIIRNNKNIGGNANILRSYEQATFPYVWVLGDNDYLNFDKCDDFIEAIESEKYDLIICCSERYTSNDSENILPTPNDEPISEYIKRHNGYKENYLENTTQELALIIKEHYFSINGFISSTIYKTSIIDSDYLIQGSYYIARFFPHFPLITKSLDENLLTYKTKYDVVFKQPDEYSEDIGIELYSKYLECLVLIKNKKIRSYAEKLGGNDIYYELASQIIYAKATKDEHLKNAILGFIKNMYNLRGWGRGFLYQIYILMLYCIPTFICKYIVKKRNPM